MPAVAVRAGARACRRPVHPCTPRAAVRAGGDVGRHSPA